MSGERPVIQLETRHGRVDVKLNSAHDVMMSAGNPGNSNPEGIRLHGVLYKLEVQLRRGSYNGEVFWITGHGGMGRVDRKRDGRPSAAAERALEEMAVDFGEWAAQSPGSMMEAQHAYVGAHLANQRKSISERIRSLRVAEVARDEMLAMLGLPPEPSALKEISDG